MRTSSYINGEWISTASTSEVRNPATGELIAQVSQCGAKEAHMAVDAAVAAFPAWKNRTANERSGLLRKLFELVISHKDSLAKLLTAEQGKPLLEAEREVVYGASFLEWYAEEAKRVYGETIPASHPTRRMIVIKEPVGVVGAITPWNFPNAMVTRKIAPALAAGCCVVLKPAPETPLSALAIAGLAAEAGFPAGVLNIVPGDAETIARVLFDSPSVRKISFTGSTAVGKHLMRESANTVKRITMELGGNAPFIVFDDADIDLAVRQGISAKYRNAGQTCICVNRFLIQNSVLEAFEERLVTESAKLKVGDGSRPGVDIGPLINPKAIKKVRDLLIDAIEHGARLALGTVPSEDARFISPCVLNGVTPEMRIFKEEIFGPIAIIVPFSSEAEAINIANSTEYGLASYLFTQQLSRAYRVAESLEFGMVGINDTAISAPQAPFGGIKASGIGREGGHFGIEEYLAIKYLHLAI